MRSLLRLAEWWLARSRADVKRGLQDWRGEPEWPLLFGAFVLFGSFLVHWIGYRLALHQIAWPFAEAPIFRPTRWEGRVGWRKPLVFGISNAMVFCSLREALKSQRLLPRGTLAHAATWPTLVEVAIITLQAWRGVPSHFNISTRLDSLLYLVKLTGVSFLGASCFCITLGVLLRPVSRATKVLALQNGMTMLCVSVMVAAVQVVHGHFYKSALPGEEALCRWATAGTSSSPCYEIRGRAVVKIAHFLPLHITEILLLLEWMLQTLLEAGCKSPFGSRTLHFAASSCWLMSVVGILQVLRGESLLVGVELLYSWEGRLIFGAAAALAAIFLSVGLAPGSKPFHVIREKSQ
mmetsp:Transcript_52379/g.117544  ORF Transcript_52379/g.117544 Transcript_52379/m.117544 type:complete len:350 (+) Transcript_52379:38-1087(+)